jgi:hypothetical protein
MAKGRNNAFDLQTAYNEAEVPMASAPASAAPASADIIIPGDAAAQLVSLIQAGDCQGVLGVVSQYIQ